MQPPEEVWFQESEPDSTSPESRLTLKCQASPNAESFEWRKNGEPLLVEGHIEWQKPGQSGSIVLVHPRESDQGYYQCFVSNIQGTAVTNRVDVRMGGERGKEERERRYSSINLSLDASADEMKGRSPAGRTQMILGRRFLRARLKRPQGEGGSCSVGAFPVSTGEDS